MAGVELTRTAPNLRGPTPATAPAPSAARVGTTATTPTTTTLIAPATVLAPDPIQLEAIVSPAPAPIDGYTPAVMFTLGGEPWIPGVLDPSGHAIAIQSMPIGTYEIAATFGPWGDLEASASVTAIVNVVQVPGLATVLANTSVQSSHGLAGLAGASGVNSPDPSPGLAVGPYWIGQATSTGMRFFSRQTKDAFEVPLEDFFLESFAVSDHPHQPQVLYDELHQRWIAAEVAWGAEGHLILAYSLNNDPGEGWWVYDFVLGAGKFPSNPSIGRSDNKIAIGFDEWSASPEFVGGRLLVIRSGSLDLGEEITYYATAANPNEMSWRPAVGQSTGNTLHAVAASPGYGSGHILHMTVTGNAPAPTFTVEDLTAGGLALPGPGEPIYAYAPTPNGDTVGVLAPSGPTAAVWQNGSLWFVSTRACLTPEASAFTPEACVRVTELSTGATTGLVQDFVVNSEGRSTYDGGIGITGGGDLVLVFTRSNGAGGALEPSPVSLYAAVQKASDPPNTIHVPALLDQADGMFGFVNWSASTPIVRDPGDPAALWQGGAVTTSAGWRTLVSRLAITTGALDGTLVVNGGRSHVNSLRIAVGGSPAAGNRGTLMRLSNKPSTSGGKLAQGKDFATSDEISWSLSDPATGGTQATGARTVYVQWGDGAGTWSSVESASVTVDTPLGASLVPLDPARLLDTRTGNGLSGKFVALQPRNFQVTGRGGVPAGAVAVTGNLTVTGPTRSGYVFLGPTATSTPASSTLNFPLNATVANGVTVKLSGTGKLGAVYIAPAGASTHLIFDVTGYFVVADPNAPTGSTWHPIEPVRVLDTRGSGDFARFPTGHPITFHFFWATIPMNVTAVTANVTITGQTSAGYLFLGPTASANPTSSTINVALTDTRANNTTVRAAPGNLLAAVWKGAPGSSTQVIVDITGYFASGPSGATYVPLAPARLLDTRFGTGLSGPFKHGVPRTLTAAGRGGIPASDTLGITGNLTVTGSSSNGYAFVGPTPIANPTSSTINFRQGRDRANGLDVALSNGASVSAVFRGTVGATTHLLLDVTGYFR